MAFRPCIDLREGRVVQIVGGTLTEDGVGTVTNFVSERSAADFATLYRKDRLRGGHVIMLGPGCEDAARLALAAYPEGLQIGGGISAENAGRWLDAGASHVIVTSFLFENGDLSPRRLQAMIKATGKDHLIIDISCRRGSDGHYYIATNRWQTMTPTRLDAALIRALEPFCAEFLVHAADVEGKCQGIDETLVRLLGEWITLPTTYAGGAKSISDIHWVAELSGGKIDLTIGSALDIFGGALVRYEDAAKQGSYPCPCCGFLVFNESPGSYSYCSVCAWQDDLCQLRFATFPGGANKPSLVEAQLNYVRYGASQIGIQPRAPSSAGFERDAKWRLIDLKTDNIELSSTGNHGRTYPKDRATLYYWRDTYWRR